MGDTDRENYMRSLMLVLPYHANNMNADSLQDMYTMSPITKMINSEGKPVTKEPSKQIFPVFRVKSQPSTTTTLRTTISTTTQAATTPKIEQKQKFHSHFKSDNKKDNNIDEVLGSIGLFADFKPLPTLTASTTSDPATLTNSIVETTTEVSEDLRELLRSFGLLKEDNNTVGLTPIPPIDVDIQDILPTAEPSKAIKNNIIQVEEKVHQHPIPDDLEIQTPKLPTVKPDDFLAFKPLPAKMPTFDGDMDDFLKSFEEMTEKAARKEKSLKNETVATTTTIAPTTTTRKMEKIPEIDGDLVSPGLKNILNLLGIGTVRKAKKEKSPKKLKSVRPTENSITTTEKFDKKSAEDELLKLQQLLETIKELDRLNASQPARSKKKDPFAAGPDPLTNIDLGFKTTDVRKRQQTDDLPSKLTDNEPTKIMLNLQTDDTLNATVIEETDITKTETDAGISSIEIISTTKTVPKSTILEVEQETTTSSSSATTTESSRNSNLEDSFPDLGADPVTEEPLPPPRRNGFYFLADWNSFLEVGEEPNKVIIRFDPKVGDPSRFIPVTVP